MSGVDAKPWRASGHARVRPRSSIRRATLGTTPRPRSSRACALKRHQDRTGSGRFGVAIAAAAAIAIDANGAWSTGTLSALATGLASLGAEFIEQPFPDTHDRDLLHGSYPLLIAAWSRG
jgi:hypothetical protein